MSDKFNVILDTRPEQTWPSIIERTDFKQVLRFFRIYDAEELSLEQKTKYTLKIFFNSEPPQVEDLFAHIIRFIACGENPEEEKDGKEEKKVFDYNIDHGRIFAAFWQAYGIDLRTAEMHWWTFCELLNALPEDTKLMRFIELRGKKASKTDSVEFKRELRKAQEAVKISDGKSEFEKAIDSWV